MNDKFLNLLGMARRAGKLSLGHDAAKNAIFHGTSKLIILVSDASARLKDEFQGRVTSTENNVSLLFAEYTMLDISIAVGSKAGVISVDDEGFARRLLQLYREQHKEV